MATTTGTGWSNEAEDVLRRRKTSGATATSLKPALGLGQVWYEPTQQVGEVGFEPLW